MSDFFEISETRGFSETNYPYASQGQALMRIMIKSLKWSSISFILYLTISGIEYFTGFSSPDMSKFETSGKSWYDVSQGSFDISAIQSDLKFENITYFLTNFVGVILNVIKSILALASTSLLVIAAILLPVWMIFAVLRNRNYERNCFRNDIVASNLKSTILRKMAISRRLRILNGRYSKARESSSANADQIEKLEIDIRALQSIRSMRVTVNTRQSLNGNEIETQYRIEFMTDDDYASYEKMMQELKKIDSIADVAMRGKVSFGQISESRDRSRLSLRAVSVEKDKYDFSDWVDEEESESGVYEYTFHLSHLIDKRNEIKVISHKAKLWADRTGAALDDVLTTSNVKADRLSTEVSASNALYTYKLSFRIDFQNFEKYQDTIDALFGTSGTTVQIKNGDLLVAVPLPKELIVPIDVGSMYREVFGDDEE